MPLPSDWMHFTKFRPTRLTGCVMWLNGKLGSTGPMIDRCASLTAASSMYLSVADNTALSMGDVDMAACIWVRNNTSPSAGNTFGILGKWQTADQEYLLFLDNTAGTIRFKFSVRDTGDTTTTTVTASTFGTPSTGTFYFVQVYHDSVANTIGIAVNNGAFDTAATSGGIRNGTAEFDIGAHTGGSYYNGRLAHPAVWKKVPTAAEWTWLYNSGSGRSYAEIGGYSVATSLAAWWDLQETVGTTHNDRLGVSNLTDHASVGLAAGPAASPASHGDPISIWVDASGNGNSPIQTTGAQRPLYTTSSTLLPGRQAVTFDGTNDTVTLDAFAAAYTGSDKPISVFLVGAPTNVTTKTAWSFGSSSSGNPFIELDFASSIPRFVKRDDAGAQVTVTSSTAVSTSIPRIFSCVTSGTLGTMVYDGKTGTVDGAMDAGVTTMDEFGIGALRRTTNTQFYAGDIYEFIVYNRSLTLRERKAVERYLARKWKLTAGVTL